MTYGNRITLAFSLFSLLGVVTLGGMFLYTGQRELLDNRVATGARMASCLAKNIAGDVERDALFRVFQSLFRFTEGWGPGKTPVAVVVDPAQRVYATTLYPPREYLARPVSALGPEYQVLGVVVSAPNPAPFLMGEQGFFAIAPILGGEQRLGTVVIRYSLRALHEQKMRLFRLMLGFSVLLLAGLWLLGWLLGRRMASPLLSLTRTMQQVGEGDLDVRCQLRHANDEFAALGRGFEEMLRGLREKEALKEEIVKSERLAAIGQVAAGLAHEINNPLGGMLNAIDTYHKHRDNPEIAGKTIDLINRGLVQLRDIVQALLVNARLEARTLSRQDLEDLRTLLEPQARRRRVRMSWECRLEEPSGIPSSQLRQILMNLILNALQATPEGGVVRISCQARETEVRFRVEDTGSGIPAELRAHLFEPFVERARGSGLGLWVSFQIVTGLGGTIEAVDLDPGTAFLVTLPRRRMGPDRGPGDGMD